MIATVIIAIIGGTFAYWNWQSTSGQRTNVTFTVASGFTCGADGGGDITNADVTLAPAACTNPAYAIQRTVTVTTTQDQGKEIALDMWLKVNNIGSGLSGTHNFKYALTTNSSSCTTDVITEGDFYGANTTDNSEFKLLDGKQYSQSTPQAGDVYYLYIWLDAEESSQATQGQTFSMSLQGSCTDELPEVDPYIYTVNIYDENNEAGTVTWIGQAIPANVATNYQFGTPAEAMASWVNVQGVGASRPFYLKHLVENGVITESYVEFVIDTALKTQLTAACNGDSECEASIAALTEDTFTLRGLDTWDITNNQCKAQYDDGNGNCVSPYYLDNAKEIYRAFGATNCGSNPNDANFSSSSFGCSVAGLNAYATAYGTVYVNDGSAFDCSTGDEDSSTCHV